MTNEELIKAGEVMDREGVSPTVRKVVYEITGRLFDRDEEIEELKRRIEAIYLDAIHQTSVKRNIWAIRLGSTSLTGIKGYEDAERRCRAMFGLPEPSKKVEG